MDAITRKQYDNLNERIEKIQNAMKDLDRDNDVYSILNVELSELIQRRDDLSFRDASNR